LSLCLGIRLFKIGLKYSFICQDTSTRRHEEIFSVFEWSCHLLLPV